MRVTALLPTFGNEAGAFITGREFMIGLADRGHEVTVGTTARNEDEYEIGGVRVVPVRSAPTNTDVVISNHGDRRVRVVPYNAKSVLMVHGEHGRIVGRPDLIWYPSESCRNWYQTRGGANRNDFVVHPPVDPAMYVTASRPESVFLFGCTRPKGADIVTMVARRMPATKFTVVRQGTSCLPRHRYPRNVTVADRVDDPREFYSKAKAVVIPSITETYGRIGEEAALSGIPVIAADHLGGVREALGSYGVYVKRQDISAWTEAIKVATQKQPIGTDYKARLDAFEEATS